MEAIDTVNAMMQQAMKTENDSFPATTKTPSASRISGECFTDKPGKMFDDVYEFRLSYDLALTTIPPASPVPAGGGEPGMALVALIKAIRTADWNTARLHLRQEEIPPTPPKASEMKDYFQGLALNYPKTAIVTGGRSKADLADIEIRGTDNDGKKVKGSFAMKRIAGTWRVVEQSLFFSE